MGKLTSLLMSEEKILGSAVVDRLIPEEYDIKTNCAIFFSDKRVLLVPLSQKIKWIGTGFILAGLAAALIGIIIKDLAVFAYGITVGIFLGLISYAIGPALRAIEIGKLKKLPVKEISSMENVLSLYYKNIKQLKGQEFESLRGRSYFGPLIPSYLYTVELVTNLGKSHILIMNKKTYDRCMEILNKFISQ